MRPRGELQFGMFRVLPSEGRLLYRGSAREITPKALQVLVVLLENQGHVVTDEELIRRVWGETLVNREKLSTTVSALRQAIGDLRNEGNEYRFVERISGKGYRFKAPVKILEPENIPGEAGNQRITTRVVYEQVEIEQDMAVSEAVPQVIVPQRGRVPGNASAGPPLVTTEGELERSKDGGGLLPMVRQETTTPTREPLIATGRLLSGVSGSGRSLRWWTWVIVGLAGVVTLAVIETHAKHISEGSIKPIFDRLR